MSVAASLLPKPLAGAEDPYRRLVEATSLFVWRAAPNGMVDDIPGWQAITGQTVPEMRAAGWLGAIHPDDRQRVGQAWEAAKHGPQPYHCEYRLRSRDGSWRHVDVYGVPIRDADGTVVEWVGNAFDVQARKEAEEALRQSEERFRNLAQHAPIMLWMTDGSGRCVLLNERWTEVTGIVLDPERSDQWLAVVHPDDRERAQHAFQHAIRSAAPFDAEYRLRARDGHYLWVLDHATVRLNPDGSFGGHIGCVVDITERRRKEALVRTEKQRLQQLDAAKTDFLRMVAHELRTPMTPLLMQVQLLQRVHQDPASQPMLQVLERNLVRLGALVEQMLDVARFGQGGAPLERRDCDLADVASELQSMYAAAAAHAGIRLRFDLSPAPVCGDTDRLLQVAINLLSNALRFTPSGKAVSVSCGQRGDVAFLQVRDEGPGVAAEQAARLFQPFAQGHASQGGTGLGLYISRTIAESHGGRIVLDGEGGEGGATFRFEMPARPA